MFHTWNKKNEWIWELYKILRNCCNQTPTKLQLKSYKTPYTPGSFRLITVIKCLKGHKSLQMLCDGPQICGEFSCGLSVSLLWWMLYHNLTSDDSKSSPKNQIFQPEERQVWRVQNGDPAVHNGYPALTWVSENIYCTLQERLHSHLRAWPSTTMIKRQVNNHENFTSSFQLF